MKYYGSQDGSLHEFDEKSNHELVTEPTHSFEIEEAQRLGSIEKALLLKEIRRMAVYKVRAGKSPWVFYSGKMLCEKFPYMTQRSVERWMRELEETGELVISIKNKMKYDKTKSYTLPQFESIVAQNGESNVEFGESIAQNGEPIPPLSYSSSISSDIYVHMENEKKPKSNLAQFEEFWDLYPKKADKLSASAIWRKLSPEDRNAALADLPERVKSQGWRKDNGEYIPLAKNYLEGRRWEDELKVPTPIKSYGRSK